MSSKPTLLLLGSGPRVGAATVNDFSKIGFNIATTSRKGTNSLNDQGHLAIKADFNDTNPSAAAAVFDAVEAQFHSAPSVIVYNAASLTPPPDAESTLSIPETRVIADLNVNVITPYVYAQEAIRRWGAMPSSSKKLFIYTGNIMNVDIVPVPMMLDLGMGKAASAYWIGVADGAYKANGYRFIYADQRQADGKFSGGALDGPAHGTFYSQLAESNAENVPWHATFVKDKGYTKF